MKGSGTTVWEYTRRIGENRAPRPMGTGFPRYDGGGGLPDGFAWGACLGVAPPLPWVPACAGTTV